MKKSTRNLPETISWNVLAAIGSAALLVACAAEADEEAAPEEAVEEVVEEAAVAEEAADEAASAATECDPDSEACDDEGQTKDVTGGGRG